MLDRISNVSQVLNMPGLYVFDAVLHLSLVLQLQAYRELCVNSILEIHDILNVPQILKISRFWIHQESEYARF